MLKKIKDYIEDNDFRLTMSSKGIHIINYKEILSLEDERISFLTEKERFVMKGKKLLLSKLLDKEVLIQGDVNRIEVFGYEK